MTLFVTSVIGVEKNFHKDISVVPNPIQGSATIYFDNPDRKVYCLSIFNMNGQKVLELDNITSDRLELETETLSAGNYILLLSGEKIYVQKVIILNCPSTGIFILPEQIFGF